MFWLLLGANGKVLKIVGGNVIWSLRGMTGAGKEINDHRVACWIKINPFLIRGKKSDKDF